MQQENAWGQEQQPTSHNCINQIAANHILLGIVLQQLQNINETGYHRIRTYNTFLETDMTTHHSNASWLDVAIQILTLRFIDCPYWPSTVACKLVTICILHS